MKTLVASLMFAAIASAAHGATFQDVCASAFIKSDKLAKACEAGKEPEKLADGSRYKENAANGAELNALIRNLHLLASK